MTLVIAWYKGEKNSLNIMADSRVSAGGTTPPLTDHAPKIFVLNVVSRMGYDEAEKTDTLNYGFAFAGSTLAALSTHGIVSGCVQNLWSEELQPPPSVEAVANLYRYVSSYVVQNPNMGFEAFVMGFCRRERRIRNFKLICRPPTTLQIEELTVKAETYHAIGSGASRVPKLMENAFERSEYSGIAEVMRLALDYESTADVGGYCQAGACSEEQGFRVFPIFKRVRPGPFRVVREYAGIPIDDFKLDDIGIGGSSVGMNFIPIGRKGL